MHFIEITAFGSALFASLGAAQLSGAVGPTTSTAHKAATKVCNVLNYGGKASRTSDIGPAIASAWAACQSGGEVYIPPGDYGMSTWVTLNHGTAVSINLNGIIYRTGTAGGNMILVEHTTDFEIYSSTSKGAVQGYGYQFHQDGKYGPRILRLVDVTNFSVHDLALVDSPAFFLSLDSCANGEVYNTIIRGGNEGGLDGIDVWSTNIHVHDVEVTNRDECVTVKSPAHNILVENIFCNWSGGSSIGSLGAGCDISNILYNNIYTHNANNMLMIKSNGGSGTFKNAVFNNFIGHTNAYSLDFNSAWSSMKKADGNGIAFSNLTFSNWHGTATNGANRAPVQALCPSAVPCHDITISNVHLWTEDGNKVLQKCSNSYGTGACLKGGNSYTAYATTTLTLTTETSYSITTMPNELQQGLGLTKSIDIPAMPTTFFPGVQPAKPLLNGSS